MKNTQNKRLLLSIVIPVIMLLIFARVGFYFYKSDGFSGLSGRLPVLLTAFLLFALSTSAFFAAWVYQDCQKRADDCVLWAAVVFIATPFIGVLLYFLRRPEIKQTCHSCGQRISLRAKYCEECGTQIENEEDDIMIIKQGTHHLKYIAAGVVSMVLMLGCLTGFIVSAAAGNSINSDISSNERVWNLGTISMNYNTCLDGIWKLDFKSADDGFVVQEDMVIKDAGTQALYADISCGGVPEDATLILWLVQGDVTRQVNVTNLTEPQKYSLNEFDNGEIHVRLQINGVRDTACEIKIL